MTGVPCQDGKKEEPPASRMRWAYGVTTVASRLTTLLPRTLDSLAHAGFDRPYLFVDGAWEHQIPEDYKAYEIACRNPPYRVHGNWVLSLYSLYLREPNVDRYALFQDDIVTCKNLRIYLEHCPFPPQGYWNLFTFRDNEQVVSNRASGWYPSNQMGRGALALVFNKAGVQLLLTSRHMVERPLDPERGWKSIDGGVVTAMQKEGWTEYIHAPSLVQHTGEMSSIGPKVHETRAKTFPGEDFNAWSLVPQSEVVR